MSFDLDRACIALKRHIRYEREKAMRWIDGFEIVDRWSYGMARLSQPYQREMNALWLRRLEQM